MREVDPDHPSVPSMTVAVYYYAVTVLLNLGVDFEDPTASIALYQDGTEYFLVVKLSTSQYTVPCKWTAVEELESKIAGDCGLRVKPSSAFEYLPFRFHGLENLLKDG